MTDNISNINDAPAANDKRELTTPQLVELAWNSYQNLQNMAQVLVNRAPKEAQQNIMTALHTTQVRFMEGLFWFERAASMSEASQGE